MERMAIEDLQAQKDELMDVAEFEGNKSNIGEVKELEVPSQFKKRGMQWVLRVATEPIETEKGDIAASELFNLKEEKNKPIGWSTQGKLQKFLDRQKVTHPKDLAGTQVTLRARDNFLGFITD